MAFRLAQPTRIMMLMVPVWPESGFLPFAVRRPGGGRYYGSGNGLGDDVAWLVTGRNINALR
jgi:hypothetical protein